MAVSSIRRAGAEDAPTLYAIHRDSVLAAYREIFPPDRYPFPADEMRTHWAAKLAEPDAVTLIGGSRERALGFVVVSPGWLESLFVVPDEWGHGVGSALHDEAVRLLRDADAGGRLWVLEANEQARRFYERRGWRYDGERRRSDYPPFPPALRYILDVEAPPAGASAAGRGARSGGSHP